MKFKFLALLFLSLIFTMSWSNGWGQAWTYDFGTGTGSHASNAASTSFLPSPTSGTSRVRVGTTPGSISLVNPGIALGTGSELQITSNTGSSSTTKFSVYDYTASESGYVKFKIAFNGGTNGVYNFTIGDGASFSDNNAIGTAQIFSGLRWSLLSSNQVTYQVLNNTTWGTIGISNSTTLFSQSTSNEYSIEIYYNNTIGSLNYDRAGTTYSIANSKWDLWVDGTLRGDDLAKAAIGTNVNIDSYAFNHQVSASTPGTIYIDDIEYSNILPSASAPASPTLNAVTLISPLSSTYGTVSTGVSFTASGSNLTDNITATAQSGYQVSTDNSNFGSSVSIASGTTVYVRFASTISAGTYNNAAAVVLSGGGASSNANVSNSSSGNTVSQKALTVMGLTAQNKVYDGLTSATTTGTAALSGVISPDAVSLTGTPTFTFVNATVGNGKTINTTGYSLTGAQAANYTLVQPILLANITAKALTITANSVTKYYGDALTGGAGSTAFTSSGLVGSETIGSVTITYGTGAAADDAVGTYTHQVTPSAATGGTFTASNYSISYLAGSITVLPTAITFDNTDNWIASGSITSYSNHSYSQSNWLFEGNEVLRQTSTPQDGVAGAFGTYSWRLEDATGSSLTATFNSSATISAFSFDVRRWDNSPDPSYTVEFSTNSGGSWTNTGTTINNSFLGSSNWKLFSYTLLSAANVTSGQFKVRIVRLGGERIMIDNFSWSGTNEIRLTAIGTAATEDFNTLIASDNSSVILNGWYISESGTNANTTYTAGTGSNNEGNTYSFGSGTECALGGLLSNDLTPTFGAKITNNTGSTINNLFITYTGETWRVGAASRSDRLDFQYSLNATSLTTGTWTAFDALDYANPGQATGSGSMQHSSTISDVITGLSISNGATFWIRWTDFDVSGADDGMAVDDFSIKPCGTVSPPTASAQSFCTASSPTIANLVATGTEIQWYSAATGGAAIATSSTLTTGTYYASQTLSGCESATRTSVAVTITNNPTAPTASPQNFCTVLSPVQVSDLTATGTEIQWYSAATGGAALATSTALTTGTYYASQTLSGCESTTRESVAVSLSNITPSITPTTGYLIWNGRTNTDFGTISNWYEYNGTTYLNASAAPSSSTNIIIPANESICVLQQPSMSLNGGNAQNLTIESGASLTMESGTLSVAGNWENNGTFTPGTGTVAFTGTANQSIVNSAGETFHKLTINKASGVVLLSNDVTIANELNLTNGIIDLQASNLNMASNAIIGGSASSYVRTSGNGVLKRNVSSSPTLFPVGKSAYNPAVLTKSSGDDDLFSVRVYDYVSATGAEGGIQTSGQTVNRTWMISESVAGGSDVTLEMYWNAGEEVNGFVYSPGFMNVMHHNGSIWEELGATSQGDSPYFIEKSQVLSFSPFTIGITGSPLPVEFLEFTAKCNEWSETVLNWSTASEHNSDYFKVEKSVDGIDWSVLATVVAAGNSTERIDYTIMDLEKSRGAYFKLWQYDFDGSESFLALIHDDCSEKLADAQPVVYPNPTTNNAFTIQLKDVKADLVKVQIYSLQGQLMYSQTVKASDEITITDLTLDKGIYQLTIQQDAKDATSLKICIQ